MCVCVYIFQKDFNLHLVEHTLTLLCQERVKIWRGYLVNILTFSDPVSSFLVNLKKVENVMASVSRVYFVLACVYMCVDDMVRMPNGGYFVSLHKRSWGVGSHNNLCIHVQVLCLRSWSVCVYLRRLLLL